MKTHGGGLVIGSACFLCVFSFENFSKADEPVPSRPKIFLNGQPAHVTVQELSGLASRPLRRLIHKNNEGRNCEFIQIHALGVGEGDKLTAELAVPVPGVRATLYRIFRAKDSPRYLSMPSTFYFAEPGVHIYEEQIEPFDEEVFIVIFEKTESPDEQNIQVRYFQEHVRELVLASYKTNLLFSSLKFKMKEFGEGGTGRFFERDAQLLIDRLNHPQRIFLLRLWRIARSAKFLPPQTAGGTS